jgi:cyclin B
MRAILIDWLVDVSEKFKLNQNTLYISIGIFDEYLSKVSVKRNKLQLIGITSLMLSAKYEDIFPPKLDDFMYVCDGAFNRKEIK